MGLKVSAWRVHSHLSFQVTDGPARLKFELEVLRDAVGELDADGAPSSEGRPGRRRRRWRAFALLALSVVRHRWSGR